MASKNKNPYREGCAYHKVFAIVQKKQIVTRQDLEETAGEEFTTHDITVVLSPRKEGTSRGDCRGNFSAKGHIYYMEKLNKKNGEPQRYRLRWYKTPLDKRVYERPASKAQKVTQKKVKKADKVEGVEGVEGVETPEAEVTPLETVETPEATN